MAATLGASPQDIVMSTFVDETEHQNEQTTKATSVLISLADKWLCIFSGKLLNIVLHKFEVSGIVLGNKSRYRAAHSQNNFLHGK